VTKQLTSGALEFLNKSLGLFGKGSPETFLEDGNVQLLLEIANLAAYSQALGPSAGVFQTNLTMVHAAAGDVLEVMDIYNPGTKFDAFASVEFADFDIWYLGTSAIVAATTQTVDEVQMILAPQSGLLGASEGLVGAGDMLLARWETSAINAGGGVFLTNVATGQSFTPPLFPFLWPRRALVAVRSQTTGAGATTINVQTLWAMVQRGSLSVCVCLCMLYVNYFTVCVSLIYMSLSVCVCLCVCVSV